MSDTSPETNKGSIDAIGGTVPPDVLEDTQPIDMSVLMVEQAANDSEIVPTHTEGYPLVRSVHGEAAAAAYRKLSKPLLFQIMAFEARGETPPQQIIDSYTRLLDTAEEVRKVERIPGPGVLVTLAAIIRGRRNPAA